MPTFCRHNHLIQNCSICAREQSIEPRPLVSSSAPGGERATRSAVKAPSGPRSGRSPARTRGPGGAVTVRRVRTTVDDGYRSPLVPGLKSRSEAESLAEELAFAATRLRALADDSPGLYREVADATGDIEERTWLAFQIAYLGPLEDEQDPFSAIRSARVSWAGGELPALDGAAAGPRSPHDPHRALQTMRAYRGWVDRGGSQASAYLGEPTWSAERRFARLFERLALPGLHRAVRFDLLVTLGQTGVFELEAGSLFLGGTDEVTVAAKRALGIGDSLLLERRAAELAQACRVPLAALDLGFYNWERGGRYTAG
ncbi:MAG TPA: hypothetical protein VE983_11230, partial [Solirubrobacteraceae bacterium]|nr:hypothetical protein [Solirubrobacteraceae bacterium]